MHIYLYRYFVIGIMSVNSHIVPLLLGSFAATGNQNTAATAVESYVTVSYTHLDVYKRQIGNIKIVFC